MTRRRIIPSVCAAVVAVLVLLFAIRVEPAFSVAWAALVGVLWLCAGVVIPQDPRADAPDIPAEPERRGTAIARMAWSLNTRTGEAGELITRRVRGILRHRLQREGLDIDDEAHRERIETRIGPGLWSRLTGQGTNRQDIERALDAIDRLSPSKEKE